MTYEGAADERDENLFRKIAMHQDELGAAYHEWCQEEVRDAITELQIQDALEHKEPIRSQIKDALARATQLNFEELDRLRKQLRERKNAVYDQEFDNFRDAREDLADIVGRYEQITGELLRIRSLASALAIGTTPGD
jgi:hypothetical protein